MKQQLTLRLWLIRATAVFGLIGAWVHTWQAPVFINLVRFTHIF